MVLQLAEAATDPFKQVAKRFQHVKCGFGCDDPIILDTKTFQHDVNRATRIQDYRQLIDAGVLEKPAFEWLANILNDNRDWNMFTLNDALPGVVIVRDLFRKEYLSSLYQHLLFELPRQHVDLLKSNEKLCNIKHLTDNQLIRSNLRWVTFGYHYDWTEKVDFDENHYECTKP